MLYPELGHEVIDELRAAQLIANQMPDLATGRNHIRMVASRLPLNTLFGISFNAESGGAAFEGLDEEGFSTRVKWEPVEVGGVGSAIGFVYDPEHALDTVAVKLSDVRVYTAEAELEKLAASNGGFTVHAAHLPVLAIRSWDLAA